MPAKSKGDDSRKCIQVLNGEKHSPYSVPNKSEQCHCCSAAQALQTLMRQADCQRKGYGRHSAGAGLTLELSPNSVAQGNNEKGKIRGDSSNKEMGKDTEHLAPQSSASHLTCSPSPVPSSLHTWAWWQGSCSSAAVGMYSIPAWYIHSHCAWVIFITQGHCSFTYL